MPPLVVGLALSASALVSPALAAQESFDVGDPVVVESRIVAVTVYQSEAAITRRVELDIPAGLSVVRFLDASAASLDPDTVQARISEGAKVIEVVVREVPVADPEAKGRAGELDARIEAIALEIAALEDDVKVLEGEWVFLDAIAAKAGERAAAATGGEALDLDEVAEQIQFLAERRTSLLLRKRELAAVLVERRRAKSVLERERQAIGSRAGSRMVQDVMVASPEGGTATIDLLYRVGNARWEPAYRIRTDVVGSRSDIEYDALVTQSTGEDWTEVALELSTADPSAPTAPPSIDPVYLDVFVPIPARGLVDAEKSTKLGVDRLAFEAGRPMAPGGFGGGGGGTGGFLGDADFAAVAFDSGLAVAYRLPRTVSVPSDAEQTQRLRIDSIDGKPKLVFVSRPITGAQTSLRATLENTTDLVLLPGDASIFVAGDYVGETSIPAVAGRGRFEVFLGPEPRLEIVKQPTIRNTTTTGLFGGGRQTSLSNRIDLENRLPRAVVVELWDRRPVSRNEKITVTVADLSRPLDANPDYLEDDAPLGLLRWTIALGAAGTVDAKASVSWTTRIAHAADIEITPIPE